MRDARRGYPRGLRAPLGSRPCTQGSPLEDPFFGARCTSIRGLDDCYHDLAAFCR